MKIVYHHRTASRDGQSTHIEEMVRALRGLGHEVTVVAPAIEDAAQSGGSGGWAGWLKRFLPKAAYELLELGYNLVAYLRLSRVLGRVRPDFLYERYNLYLLAGAWASRRRRIPMLLEVNAPMAQERRQYGGLALPSLADWAERYVWRRAQAVFPVSHVMAGILKGQGVPEQRIRVVPNGVDPAQYHELPARAAAKARLGLEDRLVIGFTGFVREWDRLDRVVEWLAGDRAPEAPVLLVIGDGPARAGIETRARELGVGDRVRFTGVVPRAQVPLHAAAFDVALQTALVPYASPLCLFEYLALGIATIAPDQPNHRELLSDRVNALLYDPGHPQGLERALDTLCADRALRERVAAGGRAVIADRRLTWRDHAQAVASIGARCAAEL